MPLRSVVSLSANIFHRASTYFVSRLSSTFRADTRFGSCSASETTRGHQKQRLQWSTSSFVCSFSVRSTWRGDSLVIFSAGEAQIGHQPFSGSFTATRTTRGAAAMSTDSASCGKNSNALQDIEDAHQAACDAGVPRYSDPSTGYKVFTRDAHEKRSFCCGNVCRHCPFGHVDVIPEYRPAGSVPKTALFAQFRKRRKAKLTVGSAWKSFEDEEPPRDVLLWSGGKNSLLALRALQNGRKLTGEDCKITLLTTYDGASGNVPFQDATVANVMAQAKREGLDILTVPINDSVTATLGGSDPLEASSHHYASTVLAALKPLRVRSLAFGDARSQASRNRREKAFYERPFPPKYPCRFPIFGVPEDRLFARLWAEDGITIKVSHVAVGDPGNGCGAEGLAVGDVLDQTLLACLPRKGAGVFFLSERREVHTHVHYHEDVGNSTRKGRMPAATSMPLSSSSGSSRSSDTSDTDSSTSESSSSSD